MRTGRNLGVRKVKNGRVGLLGVNAIVYMSKIRRRAATGLGHYAKLVAARINLERIDGAILDGLVANRDMHGNAHDAIAFAKLRRHIRPRLNHDYVLAHNYHDPSRRRLFNTKHAPATLLRNGVQAPKRRRPLHNKGQRLPGKLRAYLRFYTVY